MEIKVNELTADQIKLYNPAVFEAIRKTEDPTEEITSLRDEVEAQKASNKTLSENKDKLQGDVDNLTKERDDLKKENDTFKAEKAMGDKRAMIAEALKKAELPSEVVTDYFKESLEKLDDEGIEKAIADRKQLVEAKKGEVKNSGDEFKKTDITEADKTDVVKAATVR